jgi:hypothetical protein
MARVQYRIMSDQTAELLFQMRLAAVAVDTGLASLLERDAGALNKELAVLRHISRVWLEAFETLDTTIVDKLDLRP